MGFIKIVYRFIVNAKVSLILVNKNYTFCSNEIVIFFSSSLIISSN